MYKDFHIINDIQQYLHPDVFQGGPWIHHCTIMRDTPNGKAEYILFRHWSTNKLYLEKVKINGVNFDLIEITDEQEWLDAIEFCKVVGLIDIARHFKVATNTDPQVLKKVQAIMDRERFKRTMKNLLDLPK